MSVLIEQDHIQDFLVALENSPMTIQVMDFEMGKPTARVVKPKKGENMGFGMMMGGLRRCPMADAHDDWMMRSVDGGAGWPMTAFGGGRNCEQARMRQFMEGGRMMGPGGRAGRPIQKSRRQAGREPQREDGKAEE